jgi:hypothetical protein
MEGKGKEYRKVTINTQPILIPLGFYVITYDRNIADHFILGTAIWSNSSKLSIFGNDNSKYLLLGGTIGLAWFPWSKESIGWHIAGYATPGYKWEESNGHREESPILYTGSYIGYSFVCFKRIKLSLNAGGMYNYSFKVTDETLMKNGFTPTVMLETGIMF